MAYMVHATIFADMLTDLKAYSDTERGRILTAMLEYMETGEEPECSGNERFILPSIIGRLSREAAEQAKRAAKNRANGANGGRPSETQPNPENPVGFSETQPNPENPVATNNNYNGNLEPRTFDNNNNSNKRETESATARPAPVRHKYGQYDNVLLSEADMVKLRAEFPKDWEQRIEKLSEYMASKGTTYKNHLATIRNWARMEKERNGKTKPMPTAKDYEGNWEEVFGDG